MKVNFVSAENPHLASYRFRVKTPAYGLMHLDFDTSIKNGVDEDADINVFSKHFNKKRDADAIVGLKGKSIMDICDDHFDRQDASYYEFMCANADLVTCPNDRMQERIYQVTGRLAQIIPDPISFPRQLGFTYNMNPRFLWFGHSCNIMSIYKWMNAIPNLTLVSNIKEMGDLPGHVDFIPWAPGVVEDIIEEHDIVLLPRNEHEFAKTKSVNRAVDALHSGKFVISDFDEVYGELSDYVFLGDLKQGLDFYRDNEDTVNRMVSVGQEYVEDHFHPDIISSRWAEVLTGLDTLIEK